LPSGYRIADRYVIDAELPRQHIGRTYRAMDSQLHTQVAVNVLHAATQAPELVNQFRSHFRKAFHEHRGRVFEYGEHLGVPFAVVGYEDGIGAVVDICG